MKNVSTSRIESVLKKCEERLEELDIILRKGSCADYNYLVLKEKYKEQEIMIKEQENEIKALRNKITTLNIYREKCLNMAKENKESLNQTS